MVFYSLVRRGYIRKVSVQLVQICFSRICSTDSILCSERKKWKKTRLKQGSKTKEGKSKRCCCRQSTWIIITLLSIAPLLHRYRYAVALLSLRCRTAIAPLLFHCCYTAVAALSRCCHTAIAPVSLHCRSAAVAPAVATQSHRYRTVVAPLSNRNRSSPDRV